MNFPLFITSPHKLTEKMMTEKKVDMDPMKETEPGADTKKVTEAVQASKDKDDQSKGQTEPSKGPAEKVEDSIKSGKGPATDSDPQPERNPRNTDPSDVEVQRGESYNDALKRRVRTGNEDEDDENF